MRDRGIAVQARQFAQFLWFGAIEKLEPQRTQRTEDCCKQGHCSAQRAEMFSGTAAREESSWPPERQSVKILPLLPRDLLAKGWFPPRPLHHLRFRLSADW